MKLQTMPLRFRVWDREFGTMKTDLDLPRLMQFLQRDWQFNDDYPQYEISQDTGLKDKNGKSIYSGDIVEWDDKLWYVEYDLCNFAFRLRPTTELKSEWLSDKKEPYICVVGNIWQDRGLLGDKISEVLHA